MPVHSISSSSQNNPTSSFEDQIGLSGPVPIRCSKCPTTETGKKCKACYRKAWIESLNNSGITCSGSGCLNKQSICWYNDENDPTLKKCKACYNKVLAERRSNSGVTCSICKRNKTCKWHRDQNDLTSYKCDSCYKKVRRESKKSSGTVESAPPLGLSGPVPIRCSICNKTETTRWYKIKGSTLKKCQACYIKAHSKSLSRSGAVCCICNKTETTRWYKVKDSTLKKCHDCYKKAQL